MGFPWEISCATLFAVLAVGCSEAGNLHGQQNGKSNGQADGRPDNQRPDKQIPEVRSTDEIKVTNEGATVKLRLDADFRGQLMTVLKQEPRRSIRLTITDLERPTPNQAAERAAVIGISVFLDKPDATSATSGEDSHFVGSAIFSSDQQDADQQERVESFLFDLRPTLVRLAELNKLPPLDQPLQITIVPYLADGVKAAPENLTIPVKSASISLPGRKR